MNYGCPNVRRMLVKRSSNIFANKRQDIYITPSYSEYLYLKADFMKLFTPSRWAYD